MTKLKNTKKGMAKKALSVSLVAAMLATSNVPVWAAEDLFTDGSSAAVEAPVVEEPVAVGDTFTAEPTTETPVVEEPTAPSTLAETTGNEFSVALTDWTYNKEAVKDNKIVWDDAKSLSTNITITDNNVIEGASFYAVWKAKGEVIPGTIEGLVPGETKEKTLTIGKGLANKNLTLSVYAEKNGEIVWSYTSDSISVQPKNVNDFVDLTITGDTTYTGEEVKAAAAPQWNGTANPPELANASNYDFSYSGTDFVNVTGKDIVVTASPKDTAYTGTITATYQIQPQKVYGDTNTVNDVMKVKFKNTSIKYNGGGVNSVKINKNDIELLDEKTNADLSNVSALYSPG